MGEDLIIDIAKQAITVTIMISAPVLGLGLLVGLIVSIIQATTQIQEQTLSFIPKILAIFITLLVFGPWMMRVMMDFTINLYGLSAVAVIDMFPS